MTLNKYVKNRNGKAQIYFSIMDCMLSDTKLRTIIYSGITITENEWDKKLKRVNRKNNNAFFLNKDIREKESFLEELLYQNRGKLGFTPDQLKEQFKNEFSKDFFDKTATQSERKRNTPNRKTNKSVKNEFIKMADQYIQQLANSGHYKDSTLISKRKSLNLFKEIFDYYKIEVSIDDLTLEHWDKIQDYCTNIKKLENSTINGHRKEIRAWMNHFIKYEITSNTFHNKISKLKAPDKKFAVLTSEEIEDIKYLKIDDEETERYRKIMLFHLATGLRVEDLRTLRKENFDLSKKIIHLYLEKNNSHVTIPLPDYIVDYCKSGDIQFRRFPAQTYNIMIKKICKMAGIESKFEHVKYIGAKKIRTYPPKYEELSSHSLRRTMITQNLLKGVPAELLMKITGHTDMKSFKKYLQFTETDALKALKATFEKLDI